MKEKEYPKEDEIVLCTVSKIFPTTVFCTLESEREGVIPISEIAPGRIRNIRDHVKEGKRVVCKVLKVDEEKGHITLSLRRVTLREKKEKIEGYKKENTAKAILKTFDKKTKVKLAESSLGDARQKYDSIFNFFQIALEDKSKLSELNLDNKNLEILYNLIKERVKPKKVKVTLDLEIKSYLPEGVEKIRKVLNMKKISVKYLSAPLYRLEIETENAKEAEKLLNKEAEKLVKTFKSFGEIKIKQKH